MNKWQLKKRNKAFSSKLTITLVVLLLLMGVGFAYLSSSLRMDFKGSILGKGWNVYFDSIEGDNVTLSDDKKTLDFEFTISSLDDVYEFKADIKNDGRIDAKIDNMEDIALEGELAQYFDVTLTDEEGNELSEESVLGANSTQTINLKITFKEGIEIKEEDLTKEATVSFPIPYAEA